MWKVSHASFATRGPVTGVRHPRQPCRETMTRTDALKYIMRRAEEATWETIAEEIGEKPSVVYGWWRRGSVPKWRVRDVAAAAERYNNRSAA